jgi:hypothetical protein
VAKQYDNTNSGVLFKNDRKEKPTHPDYTGSINFEGTDCWLSAWVKEKNGKKFFSLSVKPKDGTPRKPARTEQVPRDDDYRDTFAIPDDDVPF